jgi:hypothetical protein
MGEDAACMAKPAQPCFASIVAALSGPRHMTKI